MIQPTSNSTELSKKEMEKLLSTVKESKFSTKKTQLTFLGVMLVLISFVNLPVPFYLKKKPRVTSKEEPKRLFYPPQPKMTPQPLFMVLITTIIKPHKILFLMLHALLTVLPQLLRFSMTISVLLKV